MNWFIPTLEGEREIHLECHELNFDPFLELKLISELKNFMNINEMNKFWDEIEKNISISLYKTNLEKFNSAIVLNDILVRRQKLTEILLICNNFYYKSHEAQRSSYVSLAIECRKKDTVINWWCDKWLLKEYDNNIDYTTFPTEFRFIEKKFIDLCKNKTVEDENTNFEYLLESFHTKDYIDNVKLAKLSRLRHLNLGVISCIVLTAIMSYFYLKNLVDSEDTSKALLVIAGLNVIMVIFGIKIINSIRQEKNFFN